MALRGQTDEEHKPNEGIVGTAGPRGFARVCAGFAAGAALFQSQVQISWQTQHFRKFRNIFHGKRSTFARSGTDFAASAALSQGQL